MQSLNNLSAIANRYDAFILDLWGVIHDGTHLYDGVHHTLEQLRVQNKKVVMLSNAPRRAARAIAVLEQLGLESHLYDALITSGEAGYHWLAQGKAPWGKRYYYIGPSKDLGVLDGLDYQRVDDVKSADFLLNVGFGSEEGSDEDWQPLLRAAKGLQLPMLCLNPDLEVVKITGQRFPCAGVIARDYERMGGKVTSFGKPYAAVYEECLQHFGATDKTRILAVGDSLDTDIPGALGFGVDCVLVTGGILKRFSANEIEASCREKNLAPTYIMPSFLW